MSFNAATTIANYFKNWTESGHSQVTRSSVETSSDKDSFKSERFTNPDNFDLCVYVPMGADMRFGRKNKFWRRMHLLVELKPGITYSTIPELGSNASGSLQFGFGIRSSLD